MEFDLVDPNSTYKYVAPMQSLNQSPGVTNPAKARSPDLKDIVLPAIEKQVRTNNAVKNCGWKMNFIDEGGILQVRSTRGLADIRAYDED